jgi:hypothetical protein
MCYTCFELEGSSSGRRLYIHVWYGIRYMVSISSSVGSSIKHIFLPKRLLILMHVKCTCIYNHLTEDEPSVSKHVEDIKKLKIKILIYKRCILLVYTV